jgi:hypothetical protein
MAKNSVIKMLAILSSKSGSAIFSDIFILTTLFFILTTFLIFSDIFPDVADIFVFRPSAIFRRCRCLQDWLKLLSPKSKPRSLRVALRQIPMK